MCVQAQFVMDLGGTVYVVDRRQARETAAWLMLRRRRGESVRPYGEELAATVMAFAATRRNFRPSPEDQLIG